MNEDTNMDDTGVMTDGDDTAATAMPEEGTEETAM